MTIPELVLTVAITKLLVIQIIPGIIGYALMLREERGNQKNTCVAFFC